MDSRNWLKMKTNVSTLMGALQLILAEGKGAQSYVSTLWLELNALYL